MNVLFINMYVILIF